MAAQQLAGEGFKEVINLKGGIKGWDGEEAIGPQDQGLALFDNLDSPREVLSTAYSLEDGLQDFYLQMVRSVSQPEAAKLFRKLADIEDIHKEKLAQEYSRISGENDPTALERQAAEGLLEGGMTTDEYLQLFAPDLDKEVDVISLAMSIEAQALDLYTRAGRSAPDSQAREVLERIAGEERRHLEQLGSLLDDLLEESHG